jgi:hypothetical protein
VVVVFVGKARQDRLDGLFRETMFKWSRRHESDLHRGFQLW